MDERDANLRISRARGRRFRESDIKYVVPAPPIEAASLKIPQNDLDAIIVQAVSGDRKFAGMSISASRFRAPNVTSEWIFTTYYVDKYIYIHEILIAIKLRSLFAREGERAGGREGERARGGGL